MSQTVSLIDMINNKVIARTTVIRTQNNLWILKNTDGQLGSLLDNNRTYRLSADTIANANFIVKLIKFNFDYIVIKLIPVTGGRERRRYLRLPCDITTNVVINNEILKSKITEIAYGSLVITVNKKLTTNDKVIVHIKELDGEAIINSTVYTEKNIVKQEVENSLWFEGYTYVLTIDINNTDDFFYGTFIW